MFKQPGGESPGKVLVVTLALLLSMTLDSPISAQDRLRVGVWNIEKLSASAVRGFPELQGPLAIPPRSESDLQEMAEYIRDELQVDALMVTEIEADSPLSTNEKPQSKQLNQVASKMGGNWKYFLGRTGSKMRLGLLFNTDRVQLKKLVSLDAPEFPVSGKDVLDRDPFIVWISARDGGITKNDVMLICLHLKSQQGPFKNNRMAAIAKLIGDYKNAKVRDKLTLPSPNEEPEVLIIGDCNDSSFTSNGFKYMFDYLSGVGFTHIRNDSGSYPHTRVNGSQIDHVFGSEKTVSDSLIAGSFKVHTVPGEDDQPQRMSYRKSLSDHFPVTVDLKIQSDDDFTMREAMATNNQQLRRQRMVALQDDAFERASRAMAAQTQDPEDEGELLIDFEVRDDNFEEILAPAAAVGNSTTARNVAASESPSKASIDVAMLADSRRTSVPQDRFAKSDLPVAFLEQNWSPAESVEFYSLRQGSPLMRRDLFNALEQPGGVGLFRDSDYLAGFGFLPRRPHEGNTEGYPVGFTGERAIELNCSACHTSKLTFNGKEYWIDGSQGMIDLQSWLHELVRTIRLTLQDAPEFIRDQDQFDQIRSNAQVPLDQSTKFGRLVRRLTGGTSLSIAQTKAIYDVLGKELDRRQRYNDFNDFGKAFSSDADRDAATGNVRYGFSRLDALGGILNQACAEHLDAPENARRANAPVNYPAIWDAPQHVHVQWNGAVDNTSRFGPLGRNAGQVVGVFGLVETEGTNVGYDSSINFQTLKRAEELVTKLWSPKWPDEFGAIDQTKAAAGESVYRANCIQCHAIIDRDDPRRQANDVLVPINDVFGPSGTLGTDPLMATNWNERQAKIGRLAGRNMTLPFRGRFDANPLSVVPARDILSHIVFNSITRSFVPWRDELGIDDEHSADAMTFSAVAERETLLRYKARPLNGVWSTAPYLHNGSVLNMLELLTAPDDRKESFRVGTTNFDPSTLGYQDVGPFQFNTSQPNNPGNSNQGHAYGTTLSIEFKLQLIEFLKTL